MRLGMCAVAARGAESGRRGTRISRCLAGRLRHSHRSSALCSMGSSGTGHTDAADPRSRVPMGTANAQDGLVPHCQVGGARRCSIVSGRPGQLRRANSSVKKRSLETNLLRVCRYSRHCCHWPRRQSSAVCSAKTSRFSVASRFARASLPCRNCAGRSVGGRRCS